MQRLQMPNFCHMQYPMLAKPDQTHHELRIASITGGGPHTRAGGLAHGG